LRSLFKDVQFDPQPTALRLVRQVTVNKGSIEVHFRDPKHLRKIVEAIPLIEVGDRLYFVRDNNIQDGKELIPTEENMRQSYALLFSADSPLTVSGKMEAPTPYKIVLPPRSDSNAISVRSGREVYSGNLKAYTDAHALANTIESFNDQLLKIRTADAYQLLEDRNKSRIRLPDFYPDFLTLCPDAFLITGPNLEIIQKDYITAEQPVIYISESMVGIRELQNELPDLSVISYIDPACSQSGIYCKGPLILQKGFEIFSDTDITIAGAITLYDYALNIRSNSSLRFIGAQIKAGSQVSYRAHKNIHYLGCYTRRHANTKPEDMSEEHWQQFLDFMCRTGRMQ
jgi:hypothetical protein